MNFIAPGAEPRIREIPLSLLSLAPENVRKTPPDAQADAALKASITAFGLLENLVVRPGEPDSDPGSSPGLLRVRDGVAALRYAAARLPRVRASKNPSS